MIDLTYKNDTRTNQLQVNDRGLLVAPTDALITATLTAEQVTTLKDQYDLLTTLESEYQAYYQAGLILNRGEPELIDGRKTFDVRDAEGNDTGANEYYPIWDEYNHAVDVIEGVTDGVKAVATLRNGKPEIEYDDDEIVTNGEDVYAYNDAVTSVLELNIPLIEVDELAVAKIAAKQSIVDFLKDHTLVMTAAEADTLTKNAVAGIAEAQDIGALNTLMLEIKTQAYGTGLALGLI